MKEDLNLYEIGFHLLPKLSEDEVNSAMSSIKEEILRNDGKLFSEENPKLVSLAYTIENHSEAGYEKFNKAYFGWIKFEIEGSFAHKINDFAKSDKNIIRFILVGTNKGNTTLFHKAPAQTRKEDDNQNEDGVVSNQENQQEISEEEIDKTINDLVVN